VSLRTRLLLALGVVAVAALLAADVATYTSLRTFLLSRVDQGLQQTHGPIEAAVKAGQGCRAQPGSGGEPGGGGPQGGGFPGTSNTYVAILSGTSLTVCDQAFQPATGEQFAPRLPTPITGFSLKADPNEESVYFDAPAAQKGGPEFRVRASIVPGAGTLILAVSLSDTFATLHRLLLIEVAVTGGALILAGIIGWWLVALGLRPLRGIERTAGAIAEGELGQRVPGENRKTEVGRLAAALNVMLGRIQDAFAARDATESALRESEGRLRRFVADASHELRTPVAAVSAYAELFERGAESRPEDLARVMSGIRGETARMGHLVEDLLLLAHLDESRPIERSPVDIVEVASDAIEAARIVGPGWPIRFDGGPPLVVSGDRVQLRQVFDNLISNVRAHTPRGTSATVTITREGNDAVCRVEDEGPGITAEEASRLFERFFRADPSRSRASGGAGLGLSIVAAIVAAHGGTVAAAPAGGHGAVFTVRLPLLIDDQE
jgi:two-component system OmpR family sensor kinase